MDGRSLGNAVGGEVIRLVILAFIAGGAFAVILWFGGSWLFHHLSIGWN
jgi:hypothetical protein